MSPRALSLIPSLAKNTIANNKIYNAPDTSAITNHNKRGLSTGGAVGIGVAAFVLVLAGLIIGIAIWWFYKKKNKRVDIIDSSWFTYKELFDATNGFSADNLLSDDGQSGRMYKGKLLENGREVAVKRLTVAGVQIEDQFMEVVETMCGVQHPHLVSLISYCIHGGRRFAVYDYVPYNTLYHHLHGDGMPPMAWDNRLKIAVGVARALSYLHEECHPRIIHRNITSSNILVDDNFEAQVSDFGLDRVALEMHFTMIMDMREAGYLDPQYIRTGKVNDKTDIFAYGIVLVELVTGHQTSELSQIFGNGNPDQPLRLLKQRLNAGEFDSLVDPKLEKNYNETEMKLMIEVAVACIRRRGKRRPRMGQVVTAFESMNSSSLDPEDEDALLRQFRLIAFGTLDYS